MRSRRRFVRFTFPWGMSLPQVNDMGFILDNPDRRTARLCEYADTKPRKIRSRASTSFSDVDRHGVRSASQVPDAFSSSGVTRQR